jgi:hypothetical protein
MLAVATRHHPLSKKIIITVTGVGLEVVTGPVAAGGLAIGIGIGKVTATDFTIPRAVPPVGTGEQVGRKAHPEVDTEAPVGEIQSRTALHIDRQSQTNPISR